MTIMTEYQRELVEQNLELVTQVIRKRIKVYQPRDRTAVRDHGQ